MKPTYHPATADISLFGLFHALSDPVRLKIVTTLAASAAALPCNAFDVAVTKSTLSHHMRVLREAGMIQTRPQGTQTLICLRQTDLEARFPGLLQAILQAAECL